MHLLARDIGHGMMPMPRTLGPCCSNDSPGGRRRRREVFILPQGRALPSAGFILGPVVDNNFSCDLIETLDRPLIVAKLHASPLGDDHVPTALLELVADFYGPPQWVVATTSQRITGRQQPPEWGGNARFYMLVLGPVEPLSPGKHYNLVVTSKLASKSEPELPFMYVCYACFTGCCCCCTLLFPSTSFFIYCCFPFSFLFLLSIADFMMNPDAAMSCAASIFMDWSPPTPTTTPPTAS